MAQGYKGSLPFNQLCQHLYEGFGQWAVYNLVSDRQREGCLSDVEWRDCLGCEDRTPHYENLCLVCGDN